MIVGNEAALSDDTKKLREERKEARRRLEHSTAQEVLQDLECAEEAARLFPEFVNPPKQ